MVVVDDDVLGLFVSAHDDEDDGAVVLQKEHASSSSGMVNRRYARFLLLPNLFLLLQNGRSNKRSSLDTN